MTRGSSGEDCEGPPLSSSTEHLLVFLDFLYAAIFGLAITRTYELVHKTAPLSSKASIVILFLICVHVVIDDWLDAREILERNPYPRRSFRRFAYDVLIAFLSYGVLFYAQLSSTVVCILLVGILVLNIGWNRCCRREFSRSDDLPYLRVVNVGAFVGMGIFTSFYVVIGAWRAGWSAPLTWLYPAQTLRLPEVVAFVVVVYVWFLVTEIGKSLLEPHVHQGPSAPLVGRMVRRVREYLRGSE